MDDKSRKRGDEPPKEGPQKSATAAELKSLLEHQGYRCALCGSLMEAADAQADHIVPRSRGGSDHWTNIQWSCKACNSMKGTLLMADFVQRCKRIAARFGNAS